MVISRLPQRAIRHQRIRRRVRGTAVRPRLSVFRSARHLTVQLIDDAAGRTLVSVSDTHLADRTPRTPQRTPGVARGFAVGQLLARQATERGITKAVFDRGGYAYHGQVKAVAEGARQGGMEF